MWHIEKIGKARRGFWWGDLMERDHLEDLDLDVRIILKWIFKKRIGKVRNVLIWIRIGTTEMR
jgi:hypothetical protein